MNNYDWNDNAADNHQIIELDFLDDFFLFMFPDEWFHKLASIRLWICLICHQETVHFAMFGIIIHWDKSCMNPMNEDNIGASSSFSWTGCNFSAMTERYIGSLYQLSWCIGDANFQRPSSNCCPFCREIKNIRTRTHLHDSRVANLNMRSHSSYSQHDQRWHYEQRGLWTVL